MNEKDLTERLARIRSAIDRDDLATCLAEREAVDVGDWNGKQLRAIAELEIGTHFRRPDDIQSGLERVDGLLRDHLLEPQYAYNLRYNRAIGVDSLADLESDVNRKIELRRVAIREFAEVEEALPLCDLKLQAGVNLGNALSALGRRIEAIEAWNKAIDIDPDFGMARGNRGIELIHYAGLSAHHSLDIAEGWTDLKVTLADERLHRLGGQKAVERFQEVYDGFAEHAALHLDDFNVASRTLQEPRFSRFPFLNTCMHAWRCEFSTKDFALFRNAVFPISDDKRQDRVFRLVNEFKESFATARYMFDQASQVPATLDKTTRYIFQTDYSVWGVKYGLLKVSIAQLVNCLDKLSVLLSEFFGLGLDARNTYFLRLFEVGGKQLRETERQRIADVPRFTEANIALRSLAADLAELEPLKRLVDLRHGATHRAVRVRMMRVDQGCDDEDIDELELEDTVLRTANIAKHSFLYGMDAISAVSKPESALQKTGSLALDTTWDLPGYGDEA